jgi:hypothetical protein
MIHTTDGNLRNKAFTSFSFAQMKNKPSAKSVSKSSAVLDAAALQDHIVRSVLGPPHAPRTAATAGSGRPEPRTLRAQRADVPVRQKPPERTSIFSRITSTDGKIKPARQVSATTTQASSTPQQLDPVVGVLEAVLQSFSSPWECDCGAVNPGDAAGCAICGFTRSAPAANSAANPAPQSAPWHGMHKRAGDALIEQLAGTWRCDQPGCDGQNTATATSCSTCGHARATVAAARAPTLTLAQQRGLVPAPAPLLTASEWVAVERR